MANRHRGDGILVVFPAFDRATGAGREEELAVPGITHRPDLAMRIRPRDDFALIVEKFGPRAVERENSPFVGCFRGSRGVNGPPILARRRPRIEIAVAVKPFLATRLEI